MFTTCKMKCTSKVEHYVQLLEVHFTLLDKSFYLIFKKEIPHFYT